MSGGGQVLKVEAIRGGVRDLKIDAAAAMRGGLKTKEAAAVGGGDGGLKMKKEAAAMEGVDTLRRNEGVFNVVGVLAMKSWKEAAASEAADDRDLKRKEAIRPAAEEEGGILRLKKEVYAAWDLFFQAQAKRRKVREATQEKAQGRKATQETAQAPEAGKKRKKVVKNKLRQDYVDSMAARPFSIVPDLSEEKLAKHTPDFREIYAAAKFLELKNHEYWNALIAQQQEFGYAMDENEVTDDDEVVAKN